MKVKKSRRPLFVILIIVVLVLLVISWSNWRSAQNQKRAAADQARYEKICDTIQTVSDKVYIAMEGFKAAELKNVRYSLVRDNRIRLDTTIVYQTEESESGLRTTIPFTGFKKTDTILVSTTGHSKKFFSLTGFYYRPYLFYGMMGYLGNCECRLADGDYLVNGNKSYGSLLKTAGEQTSPLAGL